FRAGAFGVGGEALHGLAGCGREHVGGALEVLAELLFDGALKVGEATGESGLRTDGLLGCHGVVPPYAGTITLCVNLSMRCVKIVFPHDAAGGAAPGFAPNLAAHNPLW